MCRSLISAGLSPLHKLESELRSGKWGHWLVQPVSINKEIRYYKCVQFHGLVLNQRCYSFFTSFKLIQKYLNSNDEKKVKFTSSGIKGHEPFLLCTWESTLSCSRTIPCLIICALRCCTSSVWTSYTSINYKPLNKRSHRSWPHIGRIRLRWWPW